MCCSGPLLHMKHRESCCSKSMQKGNSPARPCAVLFLLARLPENALVLFSNLLVLVGNPMVGFGRLRHQGLGVRIVHLLRQMSSSARLRQYSGSSTSTSGGTMAVTSGALPFVLNVAPRLGTVRNRQDGPLGAILSARKRKPRKLVAFSAISPPQRGNLSTLRLVSSEKAVSPSVNS
jgi:hypothetical protein